MKIKRLTNNLFQVVDNSLYFEGTLKDTTNYLYREGYELSELEFAFQELISQDKDLAYFGVNRFFMFAVHDDNQLFAVS